MWGFVFPGQGSQFVGMGKFLFEQFRHVQILFEEASDTLQINFKKLCFDGPESDLKLTENTQPALLLTSYATYRTIEETSALKPQYVAGHSLGEYSACVSVGAIQFSDALRAVRARGEAMQRAVPLGQGAMAAFLGLDDTDVRVICQLATKDSGLGPLEPANFNCPGQVVVSGSAKTLQWLQQHISTEKYKGKKPKIIPLQVSAPFHSSLMKPAQDEMTPLLQALKFQSPGVPVIQNVNAQETSYLETLRENLIQQISAPVLWTQSIQQMKKLGVERLLECGPGKVLSGLTKKIDGALASSNIQSLEDLKALERV